MTALKVSQQFFDNQSIDWDERIKDSKIEDLSKIFNAKIPRLRPPLLDLGSGTGILLPFFQEREIEAEQVFEMDISLNMLGFAKEKYKYTYPAGCIQADGHFLPFRNNSFKTAFAFQVFPHFHHKDKAAKQIHSVLAKDGQLIILHMMDHKGLNDLHERAGGAVGNDRILPAEQLADLLQTNKFSVNHVEEKPDLYLIIAEKK